MAVSSVTTDIQDIADTFDPRVYGCRINLEHIKSLLPDSPFKRYGDVTEVKAEITDYVLHDAEQLPEALAHLQCAIQLDSTIGVRKDIEQLARQLRPKPEPAPKTRTIKPRTRKNTTKPAAQRRHPPKAAKAAGYPGAPRAGRHASQCRYQLP